MNRAICLAPERGRDHMKGSIRSHSIYGVPPVPRGLDIRGSARSRTLRSDALLSDAVAQSPTVWTFTRGRIANRPRAQSAGPSRRRVIYERSVAFFSGKPMRCTSCGSENPDSKRFCGDCGSPFGNRCERCGVENPVGKKFCGDCGADLSQPTAAPRSAEPAAAPVVGEHSEPRHRASAAI
jgi:hypothetical protein